MKVYEVFDSLKAVHFNDRTILKKDFYLMSSEQRKQFLDLEIEPLKIGNYTKTNHYKVV